MLKKSLILLALFVALLNAKSIDTKVLKNGDLVFVEAGQSAMDSAISDATRKGSVNYTHVGIVEVAKDGIFVIEANTKNGVVRTAWADFVAQNAAFDVKRVRGKHDFAAFVRKAKGYLGQPYDFYYLANNGAMYCSELVFESFADKNGAIFTAQPMNFYDENGTLPKYWKELYDGLGVAVPQGELGTNPNDMSKSERLEAVEF